MGEEVLSQSEIDNLLESFSTGEVNADELQSNEDRRRIQAYDFKRALRFSKEQIRSLSRMHENFARILGTSLSSELRTYTQVAVDTIDQLPYSEFIGSVSKKTILVTIDVPPLEGRVLLEISPTIAFAIMDRLLGGYGESYESVIRDSLTHIEERILSRIFDTMGMNLKEAWESMTSIDPIVSDIEVNTQFVQLASPNETVVIVPLNVSIGDTKGMMNLCIPHMVLESSLPKLTIQNQLQSVHKAIDENSFKHLRQNVKESELPVKAILGEASITIEDFTNVMVNDVITLNQDVHSPLVIKVGDEQKFIGTAGKSRNRLAIKIQETLKVGDD